MLEYFHLQTSFVEIGMTAHLLNFDDASIITRSSDYDIRGFAIAPAPGLADSDPLMMMSLDSAAAASRECGPESEEKGYMLGYTGARL